MGGRNIITISKIRKKSSDSMFFLFFLPKLMVELLIVCAFHFYTSILGSIFLFGDNKVDLSNLTEPKPEAYSQ